MNARLRRALGGGAQGNRRLTAATGVLLHSLLWVQILSALVFAFLTFNIVLPSGPIYDIVRPVHFFVGFVLIPLVGLKLTTTGYRFLLYYLRNGRYRRAGHPTPLARAVAGALVVSIIVVLGSGLEMWSFLNQFGVPWIPVHVISSMVFTVALGVHVFLHVREAHQEAAADLVAAPPEREPVAAEEWRSGLISRRVVLGAGLTAGVGLAVSASQVPSVAVSFLAPRRATEAALDFPLMNFEGGAQIVDVARWRLRVDGTVRSALELSYADLLSMPMEEHEYSINCVTGWTATRRWRGVPLVSLLRQAGADPNFASVRIRSTSGYYWPHSRDNCLTVGAMLVTEINGVRLNEDHGFPTRLMIPGIHGQSNIKWVDGLTVSRDAPEIFVAPNLKYDPSLPVNGHFLPRNPAGRRP